MNNNFTPKNDNNEKSKAKIFWKNVGYVALALGLAIITIFVLNLNR